MTRWEVHIAFKGGQGQEWALPPMNKADADEVVRSAKRHGLRAWAVPAVEYTFTVSDEEAP